MKALKFSLIAIFVMVAMASCEEYYTTEEYYLDDKEYWKIYDFEIETDHWKLVQGENEIGSYYEYVFDDVKLNDAYFDGIVMAYMYFDFDTKNELQVPLPYTVFDHDDIVGDFSTQYTYDVRADGRITFRVYFSDFRTGKFKPESQVFRVAILWPVYDN